MPKIFSSMPLFAFFSLITVSLALLTGCDKNSDKPAPTRPDHAAAESASQPIRIAAAANLSHVLPQIITAFNQQMPDASQKIEVSYASSGKLYTQITQNAPYDIFLSANQEFPAKLVQSQSGKYGQPFTYTQGQLALYSTTKALGKDAVSTIQQNFSSSLDKNHLDKSKFDKTSPLKLAIANPELAPYGKSAQYWLDSHQLTPQVKDHLVMGDNIEQAFTFANTGNADFGLVAVSQLIGNTDTASKPIPTNHYLILPVGSYPAIKQDGVILHANPVSEAFVKFLLSPQAQAILVKSGYLPIN